MARLVVVRHPGPMDGLRTYSVIVDQHRVGDISEGERKVFTIPPGTHTVSLKLDLGRSRELTITAEGSNDVAIQCRSGQYSPLRMILRRRNYIQIAPAERELARQRSLREELKLRMVVLLVGSLTAVIVVLPVTFAAGGHGPLVSIAIATLICLVGVWCAFVPSPTPRSSSRRQ